MTERKKKLYDTFMANYNYWYDIFYKSCKGESEFKKDMLALQKKAMVSFDENYKKSLSFARIVNEVADFREDGFTSDREAAAFMMAYQTINTALEMNQ